MVAIIIPGRYGPVVAGGTSSLTPTTWDSATVGADGGLLNGDLDLYKPSTDATFCSVRSVAGKLTGKWYFEVKIIAFNDNIGIGLADETTPGAMSTYLGNIADSCMAFSTGSDFVSGFTNAATAGLSLAVNDVVGVAFDSGAKQAFVAKNNSWLASGDPVAGTTPWKTWAASKTIHAGATIYRNTDKVRLLQSLTYTPPSGYSQLA